jgi:tetratricopeptide (TPR) repeat protein
MRKLLWLALVLCAAWDPVTRKQSDVATGNKQLADGKLAEAEASYRKALEALPGQAGVLFDLGAALYKQAHALPKGEQRGKLLEAAEKEFRLAGDAPETPLRATAHYNLGNTLFDQEKYKEAIEEYKKSLKLDPTSEAARHNLELALVRIPPPPPPQQQPQQGDQKKDDQQKPDPTQQQQQQGQGQGEQKQDASTPPKDHPANEPKPEPPKADGQGQEPQPKPGDKEQPQPQPQPGEQKPDSKQQGQASAGQDSEGNGDMESKLDALERRSKDLQIGKARDRARERRRGRPAKDW